jgi:hypothetical protein
MTPGPSVFLAKITGRGRSTSYRIVALIGGVVGALFLGATRDAVLGTARRYADAIAPRGVGTKRDAGTRR